MWLGREQGWVTFQVPLVFIVQEKIQKFPYVLCCRATLYGLLKELAPGGSAGKESACNAGDWGSIPASGRSPEEGMATHSSILAWRSPWTEEPGGLLSVESQEEGMTEQLIFCFQELSAPGKLRVSKLLQTFETLQTTADGKYYCF